MLLSVRRLPELYFLLALAVFCLSAYFNMGAMEGVPGSSLSRPLSGLAFFVWLFSLAKLSVPGYVLHKPPTIILLVMLFCCWSAIPTTLAPSRTFFDTVLNVIMTLFPMITLYVTYNTVLNDGRSRWHSWLFVFMVFVYVFQYVNVFGYVNMFASNHLICSYYTLYMLPLVFLNKSKTVRIVMGIVVSITLFTSVKRAGVLALAASLPVYIFTNQYVNKKLKASSIVISLLLIAAIAGLFFFLGTMGEDNIFERFENIGNDGGSGRTQVWSKAYKLIADLDFFPLLTGNGYNAVVRDSPVQLSAHNDFLEVAYDYGLIGLTLYLGVFLSIGLYVLQLLRRKSPLAPSAAMMFTLYFILSMISHIIIYYWANIVMMTYGYIMALDRRDGRVT